MYIEAAASLLETMTTIQYLIISASGALKYEM
jgi:hypothetical protein